MSIAELSWLRLRAWLWKAWKTPFVRRRFPPLPQRYYYGADKDVLSVGLTKWHILAHYVFAFLCLDKGDTLVRSTNVVHYKQNRYEVPKGSYRPERQALLEPNLEDGTLRISDAETGALLAEHNILFGAKGRKIPLPKNAERYRETRFDDLKQRILDALTGNGQIAGFLEKIQANYHRYTRDQYTIILKAMKTYSKEELETALRYCVERDLHSAVYLRETLLYLRGAEPPAAKRSVLPEKYRNVRAESRFPTYKSFKDFDKAFQKQIFKAEEQTKA